MKSFLSAFFIFLLWSALAVWYYTYEVKGLSIGSKTREEVLSVNTSSVDSLPSVEYEKPLEITPDSLQSLFVTYSGSPEIKEQVSSEYQKQIFDYLNDHLSMELIITGIFNSNEAELLGTDRSQNLKNKLIDYGINPDRITTNASEQQFDYDKDGAYTDGLRLSFRELSEERLEKIESGIANRTLYSGFGSENFKADNSLTAYTLELKDYLKKYPEKTIIITGHTDNVGDEIDNQWIGMQRAKSVRNYLISQGISEDKIVATSKGELQPIESNTTKEGRRLNRRIVINLN